MLVLITVSLVALLDLSDAQCFLTKSVTRTSPYGTKETYCEYKKFQFAAGCTFQLASPECIKCNCTSTMMNCCMYGQSASNVHAEGCNNAEVML
ncbi:unnamed protein product [Rotaria sordida]|uniref:Uncharacterized protein n=1 Tax=Rotaria sordida TaxID=392033 RepID=A0A814YBM9_9BILA|nr:unnamed protein product [Rotaria sordida]